MSFNLKKTFYLTIFILFSCQSNTILKDVSTDYYNIANEYFQLKKYEQAIELYKKAKNLNKNLLKNDYNLARALVEVKKYSEAQDILENLLKKDPKNSLLQSNLAFLYYKLGDSKKAKETYLKLIQTNKVDTASRYNLALILKEENNIKDAIDALKEILDIDKEGSKEKDFALKLLYMIFFDKEDFEKASYYLGQVKEKKEDVYLQLVEVYKKIKDYEEALNAVDGYLKIVDNPDLNLLKEKAILLLTKLSKGAEGIAVLKDLFEKGYDNFDQVEKELLNEKNLVSQKEVKKTIDFYRNKKIKK